VRHYLRASMCQGPPSKVPLRVGDPGTHIIHRSLGRPKSTVHIQLSWLLKGDVCYDVITRLSFAHKTKSIYFAGVIYLLLNNILC